MHSVTYAGGAYSAPRPLPLFKGPTSKGMEGNGRGGRKGKGEGREEVGRDLAHPKILVWRPLCISCIRAVCPCYKLGCKRFKTLNDRVRSSHRSEIRLWRSVMILNVISVIRARDLHLPQQAAFNGVYVQVTQSRYEYYSY